MSLLTLVSWLCSGSCLLAPHLGTYFHRVPEIWERGTKEATLDLAGESGILSKYCTVLARVPSLSRCIWEKNDFILFEEIHRKAILYSLKVLSI